MRFRIKDLSCDPKPQEDELMEAAKQEEQRMAKENLSQGASALANKKGLRNQLLLLAKNTLDLSEEEHAVLGALQPAEGAPNSSREGKDASRASMRD